MNLLKKSISFFQIEFFYLFDTFEGFDKRDIEIEKQKNFSLAETNNLNNTSVEFVCK